MTNFTSLTPEQVRNPVDVSMPHLPMEQLARQSRENYQAMITLPNWDGRGNQQRYIKQVDGSWIDCYNECYVTEKFVMDRVADFKRNHPDNGIT